MVIDVLATGSSGNCIVLQDGSMKHRLLLDAGIPFKTILKAVNYEIASVDGALISHGHSDHVRAVDDLLLYGVDTFRPYMEQHQVKTFNSFWSVQAFELPHDGVPNRGFLIVADGERLLYMTDYEYCKYNFAEIKPTAFVIECNYQSDYADEEAVNFDHRLLGHAELQTVKDFIKANMTDSLKLVLLTHPSANALDKDEAVSQIKEIVGENVSVYMAQKGLRIGV